MDYLERLEKELEEHGYGSRYKKLCLYYASRVLENNMPVIFDNRHLALLMGVEAATLGYYISNTDQFYTVKSIAKKNGGVRKISMPSYNLKKIQRWILKNILYNIKVTEYSTAFINGKSILDNAIPHVNKAVVINLDIKDFFPSIDFKRIFLLFYNKGYTKEVSYSITKLLTFRGELPQGSPASPYISNIVITALDYRIGGLSKKYDFSYTRYADDITISGEQKILGNIEFIIKLIKREGFNINTRKMKILEKSERQEVTGLVVNNSVKVKKEFKREIRKDIYYCKKYGVYSHLKYKGNETKSFYKEYMYGKVNFILMIEPEEGKKLLNELNEIDWNS